LCAQQGNKTLLISTDPAHNLGDIFSQKIGGKITADNCSVTAVIFPPIFWLNISPRLCAGSVDISNVLFSCCADFQAIAAAEVDFPTPPFPPTKITFFVNSFILKPPFNSNVFLPLAISPSPCVNANHEIFQSCRDTTPMYNKMPDSVYQSF